MKNHFYLGSTFKFYKFSMCFGKDLLKVLLKSFFTFFSNFTAIT